MSVDRMAVIERWTLAPTSHNHLASIEEGPRIAERIEVVPAEQLREAVEALEKAEAEVERLGQLLAGAADAMRAYGDEDRYGDLLGLGE